MDSAANSHMCNNLKLMTGYLANSTKVGGLTSNGILPERGIVKIRLAKKNGNKKLILNLQNVIYLSNSPSNLVSLRLFNDTSIYHNNESPILNNKVFWKLFAFVQH